MWKKLMIKNTTTSLLYQIVAMACGFIVPYLIINYYGSAANGLVSSISQFLAFISFLDFGVGAVIQSALYKPLVDNDKTQISRIISSGSIFFRRIAFILLFYIAILILVFPRFTNSPYSYFGTSLLILAIGFSSFAEFYFGILDRMLITADQHGYIQYSVQIVTLLLNTLVCTILILCGFSIQTVKIASSLIYLIRPIVIRIYVNNHYVINRKESFTEEPLKQKWNGIAQHIAAVVLDVTDIPVLTFFSTLQNVSIYSVYYMVVYGIKRLFLSLMNGIQARLGELWARQDLKSLRTLFGWVEWVVHSGVVLVFGCTASLIVPFVKIYTNDVSDANYIVPSFALLLTLAHAFHCLRLPYNIMILAGNHYKQTQWNYIVASIINIVISIIGVIHWGIIGVAIGTLSAMLFQTVWMAWYNSKNFINWKLSLFFKQIATDIISFSISFYLSSLISFYGSSFSSWIVLALKVFSIWVIVGLIINTLLYNKHIMHLAKIIKRRFF